MSKIYDVCIVGGGMVGMALARGLSACEMNICLVEGSCPEINWDEETPALRVSAINQASEQLLKKINVWDGINKSSLTPYTDMKVWDAVSDGKIHMSCIDIGETELGYIIENRAILKSLYDSSASLDFDLSINVHIKRITGDPGDWHLLLGNGQTIQTKLIIGADGANSWVRKEMGFEVTEKPYQQNAIVAVVEMQKTHEYTAWQRFLPTGPLAFLPLNNQHQCSIVWSCDTQKANNLVKLDSVDFCQELQNAIENKFEAFKLLTKKVQFPLIERHVKSYCKPGVVLVGDAAHTIHPLAGQGVNLGFKDAATLIDVITKAYQSNRLIYDISTLQKYEKARRFDNQSTIYAMQFFKECFSNENKAFSLFRGFGLNTVDKIKLIKNKLIYQAMGL